MSTHAIIHIVVTGFLFLCILFKSLRSPDFDSYIGDYALCGLAGSICSMDTHTSSVVNMLALLLVAYRLGRR